MKVIAIVGMPGSGKTEALNVIAENGITVFNMGNVITKIVPAKRGIKKIDEYIENEIRRDIRKKFGPAAVAIVTAEEVEKIDADTIAIAGLHSFAELEYFKKRFGNDFHLISIETSKETRFKRVSKREYRALDKEAFEHREKSYSEDFDINEIMKKAEFKINNEGPLKDLKKNVEKIINKILGKR